jgi:hypothetical protein
MNLKQYHEYFESIAAELLNHTEAHPKFLRASRVEFDNGSIEALSAGVKSKLNFTTPVLVIIDYTGALSLKYIENRRDSKNASFALLIQKKDKEELNQYAELEELAKKEIIKKMFQDWKKAMKSGSKEYEFVRGFDLNQINYEQIRGGFDNNLIGWVFNFQIHEKIGF